ncbi:MAG: hypothetical protein WCF24_04965 [Acidimicrobiales bacterium]
MFAPALFALVALGSMGFGMPVEGASKSRSAVASVQSAQRSVVEEINAVRRHFGLAPGTLTRAYQSIVAASARSDSDPIVRFSGGVIEEYGVWGIATSTDSALPPGPSVIVHGWVYEDG